jgi:alkanesulfonate monooxygenase SsuD/methylene tetrahydromethanopterin reductase-like flavin-dependent oxidoreductase (luciferase family)
MVDVIKPLPPQTPHIPACGLPQVQASAAEQAGVLVGLSSTVKQLQQDIRDTEQLVEAVQGRLFALRSAHYVK